MRTAIWSMVLRASEYAPPSVCEPSSTCMPNARPWRTSRSSSRARFLGELVVLDEELLELVHDQQDARAVLTASRRLSRPAIPRYARQDPFARRRRGTSRRARCRIAVEPLQHAQAELALALDGHDAGVRQPVLRRTP